MDCPNFTIASSGPNVGDNCDTRGGPTTCSLAQGRSFTVTAYLDSVGSHPYEFEQVGLQFTGVHVVDPAPHATWPGCTKQAYYITTSSAYNGCGVAIGAPSTAYTGVLGTFTFSCDASGSISMLHGSDYTWLADSATLYAEGDGTSETLTVNCVAPQTYPGDTDGDGCPDAREQGINMMMGGRRNFLNPWDWWDPTGDHLDRIDDVLAVASHYGKNAGDAAYDAKYDRTYIGPNPWNLGPPNGQIRIDDVLAMLHQYGASCSAS